MWQVINVFVALLLLGATILVLIATGFAAYAAVRSYSVSRMALYYQLLARYSSSEMGKALDIISELYHTREDDPEKTAFIEILKQYRRCRENKHAGDKDLKVRREVAIGQSSMKCVSFFGYSHEETNQARRQVSHFFSTAFEMFTDNEALNKASFQKICALNSFKLLYHVVEWLELAHATSWEYDRDKFTKLLCQSGRHPDEIDELMNHRPPETWGEVEQMTQLNQP